jgi:release factor glutamine methyltransferase
LLKNSDVFENFQTEKFDLIVSNPPYISESDFEGLQKEVRHFEPKNALTDGKDGLSIIEKIIQNAPDFLASEGFLLIENGFNQSTEVRRMFSSQLWQSVEFLPDLQGILRVVKAQKAF